MTHSTYPAQLVASGRAESLVVRAGRHLRSVDSR